MTDDEELKWLEGIILVERILHGLTPDGKDDHLTGREAVVDSWPCYDRGN